MQKNHQLELARNFVLFTDKNIFLTGKAGTGKTTFLQNLKKECPKRMAIVAPTGVAAINAGGVTIHSLFQMPFGPYLAESVSPGASENLSKNRKFNKEKIKLIQSLDLLVIDEISMVRADLLDGIDEVLRRYKNRFKPFGGVQLLMIGDLHQLSPVVREDDWKILRPYYSNLYFFSSKALQQALPVCIELKHIYRQSDTFFIDILNKVRENRIDSEVLEQLNQRYIPDFKPDESEGYITLTTHNNTAQEINYSKLKSIEKKVSVFKATVTGDFPEYSYPTETELELKLEAQVMFVKNDSSREKLYYNGKIGKVTRIEDEKVYVKCPGDHFEIEVSPVQWDNLKYELNTETKEVEEKTIGTFTQFPLKLAWAITIHKSQGLTFEKAIIDAGASFAHGQVYVALSRCKTFEGMVLRSPIYNNSVKTDGTISNFTKQAEENTPGEHHLAAAKASFQQSMLFELFDFNLLKSRFFYCTKLVQDHSTIFPDSTLTDLDEIRSLAEKEIYSISETFRREILKLLDGNNLPEDNQPLQDRIKKGSKYFYEKLQLIFINKLKEISFETDNKAVNKSLKEVNENLKRELITKLSTLKTAQSGFITLEYLKAKANAEIDYQPAEKAPEVKEFSTLKNIPNAELYSKLKIWRDNLAKENNIPVYIVLPSKVLIELVSALPSNLIQLEQIKGIGKQKVRQFGNDIIEIIESYCQKNGIERTESEELPVQGSKIKTDTKRVSFDLFKSGKTLEEIAHERSLTPRTIEDHLIHFVGLGELDLYDLVSREKATPIMEFIKSNKVSSLTDIKAVLGEEYSYGEIKAVLKHLQATEVQV